MKQIFFVILFSVFQFVSAQQLHKMKDLFPEKNFPFELKSGKPQTRALHESYKSQFPKSESMTAIYPVGKLPVGINLFGYLWVSESSGSYQVWVTLFNEQFTKVVGTHNLSTISKQTAFKFSPIKQQASQIGLLIQTAGGNWKIIFNKAKGAWQLVKA